MNSFGAISEQLVTVTFSYLTMNECCKWAALYLFSTERRQQGSSRKAVCEHRKSAVRGQ